MTDRLQTLEDLLARLRGPDGCPWDREQRLEDLRAYLLEEAHETAGAIDAGDPEALADELGDLLFQLVFVARLGEEAGGPDLGGIVERVHRKMVARHPHVFGDEQARDAATVRRSWEQRKARERGEILDGMPSSLPALVAAYRMTQKAAGVGFDWKRGEDVLAKIEEEIAELRRELEQSTTASSTGVREEVGDLLFTVANLARKLEIDPEAALAGANAKFRRRFGHIERSLEDREGGLAEAEPEELERLWRQAKDRETDPSG